MAMSLGSLSALPDGAKAGVDLPPLYRVGQLNQRNRNSPVRHRFLTLAVAGAALLLAAAAAADDFISKTELPDKVLKKNIERLATLVMSKELNESNLSFKVTRLLGRENLGHGKSRVWFCIEGVVNGKKSVGCGSDNVLIPLDSGRWILQDSKRSSWVVVEQ